MAETRELNVNPSDLAGALHRNLMETATYILQTPALNIDANGVRTYLERGQALLDALEDIQRMVANQASASGANGEARAN
jgi:hypothetical protein